MGNLRKTFDLITEIDVDDTAHQTEGHDRSFIEGLGLPAAFSSSALRLCRDDREELSHSTTDN